MAGGHSATIDIHLSCRLKTSRERDPHYPEGRGLQGRHLGDEHLGHVHWQESHSRSYETSSRTTSRTQVSYENQEFRVQLDVGHFRSDKLSIKVVDHRVVIEGKYEKQEGHGYTHREFRKTYELPSGIDADKIKSSLSADGSILEIHAPKMAVKKASEKIIPIDYLGVKSEPDSGARR